LRPIQRVIATGFATAAVASASLPALSSAWSEEVFAWPATAAAAAQAPSTSNEASFAPMGDEGSGTRRDASADAPETGSPNPPLPSAGPYRR
jgi:hypothetical protein